MDTFAVDLRDVPRVGPGPDLSAEASDLGLPVGQWPQQLALTGRTKTVTFQQVAVEMDRRENELLSVTYAAPGYTLRVFND
jgi:hypothetical protein